MRVVDELAFEVGLVEVGGLAFWLFLAWSFLFLFSGTGENVAEFVGQLLFQHFGLWVLGI